MVRKKVGKFEPRQGSASCAREELLPRGIFQSGRKGKKIELLSTDIDQAFLEKLRLPLCISFLQTRLRITKTFY